ncbi:hypothetical protein WA158_006044 [Blastocystis sp. Blastoise]
MTETYLKIQRLQEQIYELQKTADLLEDRRKDITKAIEHTNSSKQDNYYFCRGTYFVESTPQYIKEQLEKELSNINQTSDTIDNQMDSLKEDLDTLFAFRK